MEYLRHENAAYLLTYHMVFVTKYRRPVISEEITEYMKIRTSELCEKSGGSLICLESDKDHIHLLVSLPPAMSPAKAVQLIKTELSKGVRRLYWDQIKNKLWGNAFWAASYFCASTGTVSMETVKQYIYAQPTEEHHRKYNYTGKYSGTKKKKKAYKTKRRG